MNQEILLMCKWMNVLCDDQLKATNDLTTMKNSFCGK
jgi:hypothetical protein